MSILQAQVVESLSGLSDDNLSFILNMINKYMKPTSSENTLGYKKSGGVKIGMFKGKKYIADGYDFDQDNEAIAQLFEVVE